MTRLLFDQNLSPRLVSRLRDAYPDAEHVSEHGLDTATDRAVWQFAREHEYTIVTKDADFGELATLYGFPPKVVWIRRGNCATREIEALLRDSREAVLIMQADPQAGILTLY